ncbi:MAG: KilA-N domain-containing protein [Clostridia bacterium]|nr:KilA-N domain-containing protein [Clostridia bacterium]
MKKELIKTEIIVKDTSISVMRVRDVDYISLTDLAKFKNDKYPANVIIHWLSNKDTALYVGLWEELNNEKFNLTEYREIKINEIGTSSYTMSPKQWIQRTNAIGLISKGGKYSFGTYAHPDLAFEFASWLSVEFKLYLIKEFERLKKNESYQNKIEWSVRRELAKTNYRIHTDSIKENIIPTLTEKQKLYAYANEADLLNVALFGMTAKEWKDKNPNLDGNMRDYTNILQLVILSNLENLNAEMIERGIESKIRLERLNTIAKKQYNILRDSNSIEKIEKLDNNNNNKLLG